MPTTTTVTPVNSLSLLALKCASRTFDMSSRLAHISIRDQIVRAQLLARDLCAFDPEFERVLVVGAGVGGAAFAMAAAGAKKQVVVVDAGSEAFGVQKHATNRFVGPFMYEWPSAFHDDQSYPPSASASVSLGTGPARTPRWGGPEPLPASDMAKQLRKWLYDERRSLVGGSPSFWFNVDKQELKAFVQGFVRAAAENYRHWTENRPLRPMPLVGIRSATADANNPLDATLLADFQPDYVVLAAGMGQEKTTLPGGISGRNFWACDPLKVSASARETIGVFGGADGALQDVLRLLTTFDHPLMFMAHLRAHPRVAGLLDQEREALLAMEQQSRLSSTWTLGSAVFAEIDRACNEVASRLATDADVRERVRQGMRLGGGSVVHFVRSHHFSKAYLLNRFSTYLIRACRQAALKGGESAWHNAVHYELIFGAEAERSEPFSTALNGQDRRAMVVVRMPSGALERYDFDDVIVRLGIDDATIPASQMIQLSETDNGLRTALAQVPLPFLSTPSVPT